MSRLLLLLTLALGAPAALALDCLDYRTAPPSLLLASHLMPDAVRLVAADGDHLCWAGGTGTAPATRLHWYRTGTDGSLDELGMYDLQRNGVSYLPNHLDAAGSRVVVGDALGGWQVISFSEPDSPRLEWEVPTGTTIGGPVLWGERLLVPTATGLEILDLIEGGAPVRLALVTLDPDSACWDQIGQARVAVSGNRCWVIACCGTWDWWEPFLVTVDLSAPAAPVVGPPLHLGYAGDVAFFRSLVADGDRAMAALTVRRYNVRAPNYYDFHEARFFELGAAGLPVERRAANISRAGDVGLAAGRAWAAESATMRYFEHRDGNWDIRETVATCGHPRLAISDGLVWTGYGGELRVWSPGIPPSSPLLSVAYWPQDQSCVQLYAVGQRLYSLNASLFADYFYNYSWDFQELDTTDPRRLNASPGFGGIYPYQFWYCVVGSHAYTTSGICDLATHMRVNAQAPVVIGGTGNALFAWEEPDRLATWDATDPAHPVRHASFFAIDGYYWTPSPMAAASGHAVFTHGDTLISADVTAPLDPLVVDRLVLPGSQVRNLALSDGLLCVTDGRGLQLVNLDTGGHLTARGSVAVAPGGLGGLAVDGHLVYATTYSGGRLQVYDITDPEQPTLIAEPGAFGDQPFLHGELLYLAGPLVSALRRQCSPSVPVALTDLNLVWRDGAARLSWRLDTALAAVRVLARADGREWIVPWSVGSDGNVAIDTRAPRGATVGYLIQLRQDDGQWWTLAEQALEIPAAALALASPVPNPFNPATTLAFSVDAAGPVTMTVVDAAGRVVRTLVRERREAGDHEVIWRGDDDAGRPVAAGTYFVRLVTARGERVVKAALVK